MSTAADGRIVDTWLVLLLSLEMGFESAWKERSAGLQWPRWFGLLDHDPVGILQRDMEGGLPIGTGSMSMCVYVCE
jgi:hypothetical protein